MAYFIAVRPVSGRKGPPQPPGLLPQHSGRVDASKVINLFPPLATKGTLLVTKQHSEVDPIPLISAADSLCKV